MGGPNKFHCASKLVVAAIYHTLSDLITGELDLSHCQKATHLVTGFAVIIIHSEMDEGNAR